MKTQIDELDNAKPVAQTEGKIAKLAADALAGSKDKTVKLGRGEVVGLGFHYFDEGKPKSVNVPANMQPGEVFDSLFKRGITRITAGYSVKFKDSTGQHRVVEVGEYPTDAVIGSAPALNLGDQIDVLATKHLKDPSKIAFVYKK